MDGAEARGQWRAPVNAAIKLLALFSWVAARLKVDSTPWRLLLPGSSSRGTAQGKGVWAVPLN
jgi:hypothetical protein